MKHNTTTHLGLAATAALTLGVTADASAVSITTLGDDVYTDSFTGFQGSGDPTNWTTSDVSNTSDWQGTGTGSSSSGGKYSFGSTGSGVTFDGSLGFLPSSSRAINAEITFTNNTGETITEFTVGYTAEHWRAVLDGRENGWAVSYAIDAGSDVNLDDLTYVAPNNIATGAGPHGSETLSQTVTGVSIEDGSTVTFTFFGDNGTGGGSRQGVAIDDFNLSVVPEPGSLALIGLGGLLVARRRRG